MDRNELNGLGGIVIDAAISVHKTLGPGLLESAYQLAMARELELRNIYFKAQLPVDLIYKGVLLDKCYVIDILVGNSIVVEIKSVETVHPVFEAQLLTYMKLGNKKLGYLINFNVPLLKNGIKRLVNGF